MAKAGILTRKRGRPSKEESTAVATEKAILDYRLKVAELLPDAITTLKTLMKDGSDKVKEGTAKFIVAEAKEAYDLYIAEDNANGDTISPNSETHAGEQNTIPMPLTTEIREYKMAEGDD